MKGIAGAGVDGGEGVQPTPGDEAVEVQAEGSAQFLVPLHEPHSLALIVEPSAHEMQLAERELPLPPPISRGSIFAVLDTPKWVSRSMTEPVW